MSRSRHHSKYNEHPWYTLWNEPKYWRKLAKHRKRRAHALLATHRCFKDLDNGLEVMWPLDKKPWIYYW